MGFYASGTCNSIGGNPAIPAYKITLLYWTIGTKPISGIPKNHMDFMYWTSHFIYENFADIPEKPVLPANNCRCCSNQMV